MVDCDDGEDFWILDFGLLLFDCVCESESDVVLEEMARATAREGRAGET
jgi:hypothetical protein